MRLIYTRPDPYLHLGFFPQPKVVNCCIEDAPPFMNGLRALFISDVHLRSQVSDEQLSRLVDCIAAQDAEMLLLGGDYGEGIAECRRFFGVLKGLSFPLGAYAVAGNNDAFSDPAALSEIMAQANVCLLKNTAHTIALSGGRLAIAGCDDHKYGSPCTEGIFAEDEKSYRILLSHFPILPDCSCDLLLSGHTHGGQMNLCGITPYSVGFEHRFHLLGVRDMQKIGNMRMLVGNGIGVSRIPLRLGARPQVYLLNFAGKDLAGKFASEY